MVRKITTKEMWTDDKGNLVAQTYDPGTDDFITVEAPKEIEVTNFPVTQPVSGTVAVNNHPDNRGVQIEGLLTALEANNFASDTKLELVRLLLTDINNKMDTLIGIQYEIRDALQAP